MTQNLEYSDKVETTPEDIWDSWFEETHQFEADEEDIPDFERMDDYDES